MFSVRQEIENSHRALSQRLETLEEAIRQLAGHVDRMDDRCKFSIKLFLSFGFVVKVLTTPSFLLSKLHCIILFSVCLRTGAIIDFDSNLI